ncbi:SIMPL domain-containing protein [Peribacillus psychrosaccharolyticus]|uniref:SIMPL domain-containing protein n=1 Tax=Peribacillus psychrosaccharolyticus TaxID=1407 RepID=A0A974NJB2_PERPY|nr:SIMPL domain-containing protein [Peribacillus psychrosaccharolyticus]MEC2055267.1 SIMPL domain-containing protein [Peribacillus psychrosaccharolyticus]MED3745257.1 SIMPL domain-containing protein [Peribacillus psychrosaccharolyticus]QQS98970.1 SIMPL domain-containing protein [Peribacillus psychrosaccharolyticus]
MTNDSQEAWRALNDQMHIDKEHTLLVNGEGIVQASPDQATITLGVRTENIDPATAQQENALIVANVLKAMTSLGIPDDQIKTTDYRIEPQYDYQDGKEVFRNYKVTHMIEILTSQINQVGAIVDTAVKNGANSVSHIRFSLANPELVYNQALSISLRNAYQKALAITQTIRTTLVPTPLKVVELSGETLPVLYQANVFSKAAATPIQPGELTISARVQVEYEYN